MLEKLKPEVKISLDKERTLRFDLNAMAAFEEATGKSLFDKDMREEMGGKLKAGTLRALLWAMLIDDDETLTLKQVGKWITLTNMSNIAEKVIKAFETAMPESDKTQDERGESGPLAGKPPAG
jgi:hypothetical protein